MKETLKNCKIKKIFKEDGSCDMEITGKDVNGKAKGWKFTEVSVKDMHIEYEPDPDIIIEEVPYTTIIKGKVNEN